MKRFRTAISVAVLAALALGYFCSQWFALTGRASEWTSLIDVAPVVWLALIALLAEFVLWLAPEREET